MMDFETPMASIELKASLLADEVARLRQQVSEGETRCKEMQEAIKNSETTINKLKEENKLLKLGNKLSEKGESAELKLKINQMIRAIDRSLEIMKNSAM